MDLEAHLSEMACYAIVAVSIIVPLALFGGGVLLAWALSPETQRYRRRRPAANRRQNRWTRMHSLD